MPIEATMSTSNESANLLVPSFLPRGEVLGWNLTSVVNPVTRRKEYTYTVCVQTVGAFQCTEQAGVVLVKCDGPCGNKLPTNHLIALGKCDHMLCKACFGIVKNPDGSYGCSNFYCWSEPRGNFRKEKANYNKVINKQICRARKFKQDGEDLQACSKSNLPKTPADLSDREMNSAKSSESDTSSSDGSSYQSTVDSYGLPKRF
ncbi:RING-type domain-containing protein [Caenorhabditis elegans]|uniref:RING-type domain-containing protein n=1 Tax=Caenorhabditis elegans TaxID=6239 RepID=P91090_CAEEL|nr:RING-type domain-containing protein [Caenorhabditis elegans]CCD65422.1 RING-type domain-containing protein [Caenorhabditis elegans]|eukprot:NP_491585.1 Uncharacterized protein CELE_C24A11.1 [Caenorhabditis elegans]